MGNRREGGKRHRALLAAPIEHACNDAVLACLDGGESEKGRIDGENEVLVTRQRKAIQGR